MAATKPVLRPQRNVVVVGVSFIAIMIAIVVIGVVAFGSLQRQFETFAEEDSPALNHLFNIDRDLFRAQHIITTAMALDDADGRIAAVEEFRSLVAATEDRWRSYVTVAQHSELEIAFQRTYISVRVEWIDATSVLAGYAIEGRSGTDLDVTEKIVASEQLFGSLENALHTIEEQVYEPLVDQGVETPPLDPRVLLVILLGGGVALGSVAWAFALRDSARQGAELRRRVQSEAEVTAELKIRATRDVLTGLPNRAVLMHMLEEVVSSRRSSELLTAVLFLDIDKFKVINDSLGHAAGDELLVGVATRIAGVLRGDDVVGRLGGDEFLVLCHRVVSADEVMAIARRILASLGAKFIVGGREVDVTVSIGVALLEPDETADELLAAADTAAYEAKRNGRHQAKLFDSDLRHRANEELKLANALKESLERGGELIPYYQPIVDLSRIEVVSFEALCRWEHPERGLLSAQSFIDIAEKYSLEVPMSWSMMGDVTAQIAGWAADEAIQVPIRTAINVSARQLRDQDFAAKVRRYLTDTGISPDLLCIEVTEQTLVDDLDAAAAVLGGLRELGIKVAIDDFGVGHSSLSYIRSLPIDIVKLDMSFITAINDGKEAAAIVAAVIRMSKALGHTVIAEGIETVEQMATLQALRCDYGQGYLFSPAIAARDATQLLTGERRLDVLTTRT